MMIRGTLLAFKSANVFRLYHKQVTGNEPMLMQNGLRMASQDRLHGASMRRLSPNLCYEDVYLALALEDIDQEPRLGTIHETGNFIPRPIPEFQIGMHHDLVFTEKEKVNPKYLSIARESEPRQNYQQSAIKARKQFLGKHFKVKLQNRQPLTHLAF